MAEADLKMDISSKTQKKPRRFARLALMLSVPLLLIAGGVGYYIANDHYVSTDNAYVQQDKISISAEVGGRIVEVALTHAKPPQRLPDRTKMRVVHLVERGAPHRHAAMLTVVRCRRTIHVVVLGGHRRICVHRVR